MIVRYPNVEHGKKIDHCVRETVKTDLLFLTDDDSFILNPQAEPLGAEMLLKGDSRAAFSFKPRGWWELEIDGNRFPVMGSYSLMFKPEIIRREKLTFCSRPTKDPRIRNGGGYYDTGDYANEQLLRRGYEVIVPDPEVRRTMVQSYSAVSSGFVTFTRRRRFAAEYRLRKARAGLAEEIRSDVRKLEWACGIASVVSLYRRLFDEKPRFDDFFSFDDLAGTAERSGPQSRDAAKQTVRGYRRLLALLEGAA